MNFKPRYNLLEDHAKEMQANSYLLWLLDMRQKELQQEIASNNDFLSKNRKVISEKMEIERAAQNERIMALNFVNAAILEATRKKALLWQQFRTAF